MQLFKRNQQKTPPPIQTKTDFPYWTVVQTENGPGGTGWFLIKERTRTRIPTQRILDSWAVNVVSATEAAVKHYPITGKLGFRDGTLINNMGDGKIYLISQNKRRQITSPDAFDKYGIDRSKMIWVSQEEAELQIIGEVLS